MGHRPAVAKCARSSRSPVLVWFLLHSHRSLRVCVERPRAQCGRTVTFACRWERSQPVGAAAGQPGSPSRGPAGLRVTACHSSPPPSARIRRCWCPRWPAGRRRSWTTCVPPVTRRWVTCWRPDPTGCVTVGIGTRAQRRRARARRSAARAGRSGCGCWSGPAWPRRRRPVTSSPRMPRRRECARLGRSHRRGRRAGRAAGAGRRSACRSVKAPGYFDERAEPFDAGGGPGAGRRRRAGAARPGPGPGRASCGAPAARRGRCSPARWRPTAGLATVALHYDDAPYGVAYFVATWSPQRS